MRTTIVIGAGLSGLMGALALAEAGLHPLLLAKGQGATHWTAGTIDVWGADERSPHAALRAISETRPHHPYALIGVPAVEEAIARFRALTEMARYPYVGGLESNVLLPTAAGALRPATLLPVTMAAGDVRLGGKVLIAGFRELRDFYPPFIVANLAAQGITAHSAYLTVPPAFRRREYTTVIFARMFDDPAFRSDIGRQLRAQRGDTTRIGLPAVLGLRDPLEVVAHLQNESGAQVFEIPTLPPSVPGMRLFALFQNAIEQAGGRLQIGSDVIRGEGRVVDSRPSGARRRRVSKNTPSSAYCWRPAGLPAAAFGPITRALCAKPRSICRCARRQTAPAGLRRVFSTRRDMPFTRLALQLMRVCDRLAQTAR